MRFIGRAREGKRVAIISWFSLKIPSDMSERCEYYFWVDFHFGIISSRVGFAIWNFWKFAIKYLNNLIGRVK